MHHLDELKRTRSGLYLAGYFCFSLQARTECCRAQWRHGEQREFLKHRTVGPGQGRSTGLPSTRMLTSSVIATKPPTI